MLVLHGGPGGSSRGLRYILPETIERSVIFYDQLGSFYSRLPEGENHDHLWICDRFISELETVIFYFFPDHTKFNLFGHSWGGSLAAAYAIKHGQNLNSLILSSPLLATHKWISDALALLDNFHPTVKQVLLDGEKSSDLVDPEQYQSALDLVDAHHFLRTITKKFVYKGGYFNAAAYNKMWGGGEYSCHGNLKDFDLFPELKKISCPTLLTCGLYDTATPRTLAQAQTQIKNAKLHVFNNSAHCPYVDEQDFFRSVIFDFLSTVN